MAAKIYPAAQERILEIWDYTADKWGEEQADLYVRELVAVIESAQRQPRAWRQVNDKFLPEVFFLRYRKHFVFFRVLEGGTLGVISILHESMNIPARLKEDASRSDKG